MRQHRVRRRRTDVEKKRPTRFQNPFDLCGPFSTPAQIRWAILAVGKFTVANAEIVRRRGYDKIDTFIWKLRHSSDTIFPVEIVLAHRSCILNQFVSTTTKMCARLQE